MKPSDASDRVNDLMDVARAGEIRCAATARLVGSSALKACLLMAAAEHGAEAERLHRLVVELRGTPHAGETDAILADPLWRSPPDESIGEEGLLAMCIEEQAREADGIQAVLRTSGLPSPVPTVLAHIAEAAAARQRRLESLSESPNRPPAAAPDALRA